MLFQADVFKLLEKLSIAKAWFHFKTWCHTDSGLSKVPMYQNTENSDL